MGRETWGKIGRFWTWLLGRPSSRRGLWTQYSAPERKLAVQEPWSCSEIRKVKDSWAGGWGDSWHITGIKEEIIIYIETKNLYGVFFVHLRKIQALDHQLHQMSLLTFYKKDRWGWGAHFLWSSLKGKTGFSLLNLITVLKYTPVFLLQKLENQNF